MMLVVIFGSLSPWIGRESLNLMLGRQGQMRLSPLSSMGLLVLVNEAVQTSGPRSWQV